MRRYFVVILILLAISLFVAPISSVRAQEAAPVVRAVLFYSPTCPHCEYVITQTMPPLIGKYGKQLEVLSVDVTQSQGQVLFLAALQKFGLEDGGVPFLVVDSSYLMGSQDIPEKFPNLIESYLSQGGLDWPDIPGLRETYGLELEAATAQTTTTAAAVSPLSNQPQANQSIHQINDSKSNWRDRFLLDPIGNTMAVLVLAGMLGALAWTIALWRRKKGVPIRENWAWTIPVLCLIGSAIAGYLSYVETTQATAVCGPVGDCNTVQQSEYAHLFGVLPIGVLGLFGYLAIVITWLVSRYSPNRLANFATLWLFIMTTFGTLFSIYLTFLEPFIIGATCAWCLTSAVLMTILMVLMAKPAKQAYSRLTRTRSHHRAHA